MSDETRWHDHDEHPGAGRDGWRFAATRPPRPSAAHQGQSSAGLAAGDHEDFTPEQITADAIAGAEAAGFREVPPAYRWSAEIDAGEHWVVQFPRAGYGEGVCSCDNRMMAEFVADGLNRAFRKGVASQAAVGPAYQWSAEAGDGVHWLTQQASGGQTVRICQIQTSEVADSMAHLLNEAFSLGTGPAAEDEQRIAARWPGWGADPGLEAGC